MSCSICMLTQTCVCVCVCVGKLVLSAGLKGSSITLSQGKVQGPPVDFRLVAPLWPPYPERPTT